MLDKLEVKESFEKSTKDHKMEILMDNGLYRHLKFTNNGSQCYRFDLHTWPGHLCIDGDMGTYVFSRIPDMFKFFIMGEHDFNAKYIINPGYWGEKLQAIEKNGGYREFSYDIFEENITTEFNSFKEHSNLEDPEFDMLWDEISDYVLSRSDDGVRALDAAMDFKWSSDDGSETFEMSEFWDYNCDDYTYRYIWILYAIVWGIQQYNINKQEQAA